jgi:hypothetical protein
MISGRENLMRVFRHEMPEWIPVTCHVDSYSQPSREDMDPELAKAMPKVEWGNGSSATLSRYLNLDIMDYFNPPVEKKRRHVTVERITTADGWSTIYRTPRGELREVFGTAGQNGNPYCQEHLVKSAADFPALASIFEDEEFVLKADAKEFVQKRKAAIGDQGLVRCYMPGTPLGMMVRFYAGVETIAYLWADSRNEMHQLFKVMEENHLRQFRLCASLGYDILYGTDDTSTTTISPAMFEEFCMGYTDRVADAVHAHGALYAHHSCGLIRNLLDLYRQTKMDAVDALYVKPIGDVDSIAEARAHLGPRIAVMAALVQLTGNVDDRAAVAASIAQTFRDAAPGDNTVFVLAGEPAKKMADHAFIAQECRKHQRDYAAGKG